MRLARPLLAFLVLWALLPSPSAAAEDDWVFEGGGWGHGVGLSQFGALGQAKEGRKAGEILTHYYTDTKVSSPLPADHWVLQPEALSVGLAADTTLVSLAAIGNPVQICQPADCSGFSQSINPGESWVFEVNLEDGHELEGHCRFRRPQVTNTGWKECSAAIRQDPATSTRIELNGLEYAHGTIRFTPLGTPAERTFHTVVMIGLELYLRGLAEMPSSWPAEALKSQAIIGRSYAVANAIARDGKAFWADLCGCHLRSTTADQAYVGWSKESEVVNGVNYGAKWVAAVDGTTGKVLTHPQGPGTYKIVSTFYSSSNGGASEANEHVWGGTPLPWLRSVADPWSSNPSVNPLARWTVLVPSSDLATALGWATVTKSQVLAGPPGVVVRFTGKKGGSVTAKDLNGTQIAAILRAHGYGYQANGSTSPAVRVSPYIIAVKLDLRFLDIADSIFKNAILWLADQRITQGCNPPTNNKYCPNDSVTRGEMAVFIARALNLPNTSTNYFTDDNGKFYENAANKIAAAGITQGCGGTKFCGDRKVTRGEMAAFIARAFSLPSASQDYFIDDNGSMFENAINKIRKAGITEGCNPPTNNRYCPNDYVTRGQMAAFFKRALT